LGSFFLDPFVSVNASQPNDPSGKPFFGAAVTNCSLGNFGKFIFEPLADLLLEDLRRRFKF
jgi:hypothetical protein